MDFAARRVIALARGEQSELVRKFARRSGLPESTEQAVAKEVSRAEYASLAQVPVTLNLLLHVLAKGGVGDAVLSRRGPLPSSASMRSLCQAKTMVYISCSEGRPRFAIVPRQAAA